MEQAQSLFGQTPENLQLARDAALNASAAEYAKMDPFERAAFGMYKGANQLGGAVGGMMGGQDPQMQLMQRRNSMLEGLDQANPQSWLELAKKASSMGDFRGAQEAVGRAQALNKAQQESTKTTAEIGNLNATAQEKTYATSAEKRAEDILKTGHFEPASVNSYMKGMGNKGFGPLVPINKLTKPTADFAAMAVELGFKQPEKYGDLTPEQTGQINKALFDRDIALKRAGRTEVNNNIKVPHDINSVISTYETAIKTNVAVYNNASNAQGLINIAARDRNPGGYEGARTALASALGETRLSNEDIKRMGIDPTIFGGVTDWLGKKTLGVPSEKTLKAMYIIASYIKENSAGRIKSQRDSRIAAAKQYGGSTNEDASLLFPDPLASTGSNGDLTPAERQELTARRAANAARGGAQ